MAGTRFRIYRYKNRNMSILNIKNAQETRNANFFDKILVLPGKGRANMPKPKKSLKFCVVNKFKKKRMKYVPEKLAKINKKTTSERARKRERASEQAEGRKEGRKDEGRTKDRDKGRAGAVRKERERLSGRRAGQAMKERALRCAAERDAYAEKREEGRTWADGRAAGTEKEIVCAGRSRRLSSVSVADRHPIPLYGNG